MRRLLRDPDSEATLCWFCATVALFSIAVWRLRDPARATPLDLACLTSSGLSAWLAVRSAVRARCGKVAVIVGALALRAVAFVAAPRTSDDLYRYAWEADVVLDGKSPYAFAPDDPELADLRARHPELHARVAHRDVPAAYPPLAQLSFAAASLGARAFERRSESARDELSIVVLRIFACAWDLLLLVPLWRLCAGRGVPLAAVTAWAWCPLVALEFAGAGHFDSLALLAWFAALAFAPRRPALAAVALGCAGGVKLLPLAAAPNLCAARGRTKSVVIALVAFALTYLPLLALRGSKLFTGLGQYALNWESNGALFPWLDRALRSGPYEGVFDPRVVARAAVAIAWIACALWTWRRRFDGVRASFVLVGAFLVLSPTLHPWYVTWIVPFLVFEEGLAFRWLSAAAPLAYALLPRWSLEGAWIEPAWLWPTTFLPFFALLAFDLRQRSLARLAR